MDIKTFDQWINTLSTALTAGHKAGLSSTQIQNSAKILGITWPAMWSLTPRKTNCLKNCGNMGMTRKDKAWPI